MIVLDHVSKSYGSKKAVIDLSLEIKSGEVFGLLGPNGAGKSTTLKMMTGILKLDNGDILIDGKSILKENREAKMRFGFVSDSPDIFLGMKTSEYISFIGKVYKAGEKGMNEAYKLASQFGLADHLDEMIASYSHGMRQKILLIGSLLHDPDNWILDEPLTGLDPEAAFEIKSLMREKASEGKTVLFSTHVLDVAQKVCDRIGIISQGELKFVGTLDELRAKEEDSDGDLENLFLSLVKE